MKFRMLSPISTTAALLIATLCSPAFAGDKKPKPFSTKDISAWIAKPEGATQSKWLVGTAKVSQANPKQLAVSPGGTQLINATEGHRSSLDLYSRDLHGDAVIKLDVMVPKSSNSGIYLMGEYEIQVLDSDGKDANPGPGDMGAIYGAQPPKKPKYKAPGQWNTYEIHWKAPQFDASGKKTANAEFVKVILNGAIIHENLEMPSPTPGGVDGTEKAKGPLMFQGNHGPVAFRNITIKPL